MKRPRNKKYHPREVATNPLVEIFGGMGSTHAQHLQTLHLKNHAAFSALAQGRGTRDDWDRLVGAINMANVMCEQGIGNEFREQTIAARDALCEVGKRYMRIERFVFTGPELATMNEAMTCHEAQLENVRAIDIDRAANEVLRRIHHKINTTNVRAEAAKASAARPNQ
jgi:hypothetical protein